MTRKNRQHPPQEEPPLRQVRYIVTTAPRTSDPVDGYYAAFRDGFFFCTGKGASREEAIADLLPKLEEYLLREWQESKHRLLPTPLSSDEEVSTVVVSIPDVFGESYALPDEQRRKRLQERPRVAIYLQKVPDRLPERIKQHFASWLSECRTYATQQGWQVVAIYDEAEHPEKTPLLDDIRARRVDIVLVHSLHDLSHEKREVLRLYTQMRAAGVHLHETRAGDFASILQEDERFTNFLYQLDPTLRPEWVDTYTAAQRLSRENGSPSSTLTQEQEHPMSYIEERNARLALSRELQHDVETAIYLHATTEAELAEQEARCKALAKEQGLTVLAIFQELVPDAEKESHRALARLFLRPIPFEMLVVDTLAQFAREREEADDIIMELYKQHCYVLPVTEDDFKSVDQRLKGEDKQGREESEDL
jgi:DNA invertase Pin-like site-specific DNA recombinase